MHSFCNALLSKFYRSAGFEVQPKVLDESARERVLKSVACSTAKEQSFKEVERYVSYSQLLSWFNELDTRKYSSDKRDSDLLLGEFPKPIVEKIWKAYKLDMKKMGYIDYDALLTETLELLAALRDGALAKEDAEELANYLPQYLYVDEAQDLSAVQWLIAEELRRTCKIFVFVGDDDQSIYMWRGARPWRFKWALERSENVCFLTENRRCGRQIVDLGSDILEGIPRHKRVAKNLRAWREDEGRVRMSCSVDFAKQMEEISVHIYKQVASGARRYKDFAFIYRSKTDVKNIICGALRHARIPYEVLAERDAFDTPESRFIHTCLLVAESGREEPKVHWREILKDVGGSIDAVDRIIEQASLVKFSSASLLAAIGSSQVRPENKSVLSRLVHLIRSWRATGTSLGAVLDDAHFRELVEKLARKRAVDWIGSSGRGRLLQPQERQREIDSLTQERVSDAWKLYEAFREASLGDALNRLSLGERKEGDEESDMVAITSAHSSKGLEWPTVFIVEVNDGTWPSSMRESGKGVPAVMTREMLEQSEDAMDEERRLLYVAVTRAKNELFMLTQARGFRKPGSSDAGAQSSPSRFLPKYAKEKGRDLIAAVDAKGAGAGGFDVEVPKRVFASS